METKHHGKPCFSSCLNDITQFSDGTMGGKYLYILSVSVDEIVLDISQFIVLFANSISLMIRSLKHVFTFCCVADHPCIDVIAH